MNEFLHFKESTQILAEMEAAYGKSVPSFVTGKRWAADFKRPKIITLTDNIGKTDQIVLSSCRTHNNEKAMFVGISEGYLSYINLKN